jgi:Tfp pilus assembly PilM family ATPase
MFAIFKKTPSLLGVDISGNTIRLIELDKKRQVKLCAVGSKALLPANTSSKNAAIAMPHSTVIFKTIELDSNLSAYEIETYINANCQKFIGLPAEKIKLDYRTAKHIKGQKTKIELFATRTEWVEEKIAFLKSVNLNVVAVDIDSYALLRAVKQQESLFGTTAIANVNQTDSIFFVTANNKIIFYKETTSIDACLELYNSTNNSPIQRLIFIGELANTELKEDIQKIAGFPCVIMSSLPKIENCWLGYGLALRNFCRD